MTEDAVSGETLQAFGVAMLVTTVVALAFNVTLLSRGLGSPVVTSLLGVVVGVGGFVLGEIRRDTA